MSNNQIRVYKYHCNSCLYSTNTHHHYESHIKSIKHQFAIQHNDITVYKFSCPKCQKGFNSSSSFYYHKSKCSVTITNYIVGERAVSNDIIIGKIESLFNEVKQNLIPEIPLPSPPIRTHRINVQNKTEEYPSFQSIYVNSYLQNKYPNAIDIQTIIQTLRIPWSYLLDISNQVPNVYARNFPNLLVDGLSNLPREQKPFYCFKDETYPNMFVMHFKSHGKWIKENTLEFTEELLRYASGLSINENGMAGILNTFDKYILHQITESYDTNLYINDSVKQAYLKHANDYFQRSVFVTNLVNRMQFDFETLYNDIKEYQTVEINKSELLQCN